MVEPDVAAIKNFLGALPGTDRLTIGAGPSPSSDGGPISGTRLHPLTVGDLRAMDVRPRIPILGTWLAEGDLGQIYGPRGVGKTQLMVNVAYAVACGGSFLGWPAWEALPVLYVDGEMGTSNLKARLKQIEDERSQAQLPLAPAANLRFVVVDHEELGIPDLASEEGQRAFDEILGDAKLVIFDNLSSLVHSGKENEKEGWSPVQRYLLSLRRRGVAALFVHHAGKTGDQRGTSAREDVLDVVIKLTLPPDAWKTPGASFVVEVTKARSFSLSDVPPFEANLDPVTGKWSYKARGMDDQRARIHALAAQGMPQNQIATVVGCSPSHVSKTLKAAKEQGRLNFSRAAADDKGDVESARDEPPTEEAAYPF